ncbi:MAG: sulfide/dihydroorotate dehydrogenase-like FAD/NAD-binding protein, partial [Promethearchaeota archaeon]
MINQIKYLKIDGKKIKFIEGQTILEVARENGIYIPTLCHVEGLSSFGACRLCLVKVEGMKGYPTACTTPACQDMKITSNDNELQELRREVLELILSEHPYSCLVCDNRYNCEDSNVKLRKSGRTFGCYFCSNNKICEIRKVSDYLNLNNIKYELEYKNYPIERSDPFFERDFNLCILCGRCVRICNELRGIGAINFINRGHNTTVSTAYDSLHIDTNCQFCGACVDHCPTGALVPKNTQWMKKSANFTTSICGFCSVGCGFDYYAVNDKISESIPNQQNPVNKGQACLIGRFCTIQFINSRDRLRYPLMRKNGSLIPYDWEVVYETIKKNLEKFKPEEIAFIASPDLSNESAYLLNKFARKMIKTNKISSINYNSSIDIYYDLLKNQLNGDLLKRSFKDIENSNWIVLINANVQLTHPVLLINLKKAKDNGVKLISIGINNYKLPNETIKLLDYNISFSLEEILTLILSISKEIIQNDEIEKKYIKNINEFKTILEKLNNNKKKKSIFKTLLNLIFESNTKNQNNKGLIILGHIKELPKRFLKNLIGCLFNLQILSGNNVKFLPLWNRSNIEGVFQNISYKDGYSIEEIFKEIQEGKIKALYLTERVNEIKLLKNLEYLIIQDIFPSDNFKYANIVLPSCTFIEDSGSLLNSELRLQEFNKIPISLNKLKQDWMIFCDLANNMNKKNIREFQFTDSKEILVEIKKNNPYFKIHTIKDNIFSFQSNSLYIPELNINFDVIGRKDFELNSYQYRGEKISNQVPDLKKLINYRKKEIQHDFEPKEEKVVKTKYRVISNKEIVPNLYELIIEVPLIANKAKPGNFIIIMKKEESERIPLTISDWDISKGTITIYFQESGFSTMELAQLKEDDYIFSVVGPLGKDIEIKKYGTVLLGGGCYGNGAIYPFAKAMKSMGNKVIVILEARNKMLFYLEDQFEKIADQVIYCTSDGSKGLKGKIQTGIEDLLNQNIKIDQCIFIGCNYMMMQASNLTKKFGNIPTLVSLNTIMIDGTGMCGCCRLTLIQDEKEITKFACIDGP